jgi:2-polyprenyl-6-methoxyphenol hydroxylase-like FAD-dependent oxidoreductase
MAHQHQKKLIIVGGGIAGLCMAISLRNEGFLAEV